MQYSASAELQEIISCFLNFHDIIELPKKMQYPLMALLVFEHVAHSESEKALSCRVDDEEKNSS